MANLNISSTTIQEFYNNSVILISGVTGFIGKCLLYKLLNTCPDIKKIYLLARKKKDKSSADRLDEICDSEIFKDVHENFPNFRNILSIIESNLEEPNLGISEENQQIIINEVNIIFHVAATVRFDEHIKQSAKINIIATKDLISLSKKIKNLKAFLHVSTAYSHCYKRGIIEEKFYSPIRDPYQFLNYIENTDDETLTNETPKILEAYPNTYTFTKGLTEEVVRHESENLPVAIFRPSMVINAYKEPIEGWVGNLFGPLALLLGVSLGVVHVVKSKMDMIVDLVPVDLVVNAMIVATWKASQRDREKPVTIYNFTSYSKNPIKIKTLDYWGLKFTRAYISMHNIWHSFFFVATNERVYNILDYLFHKLPAKVVDMYCKFVNKEPVMEKTYERISKMLNLIGFFSEKEWQFQDDNVTKLWTELGKKDKKLYPFDMQMVEWDKYIVNGARYLRVSYLNDPLSTIPAADKKAKRALNKAIMIAETLA